jgi:hypothetical protein
MNIAQKFSVTCVSAALTLASAGVAAHVPYLEEQDFSPGEPFTVKNIPQSKAMYAFLEHEGDVDHYVMQVDEPTYIYLHTNIPYCAEYSDFTVTYALTGPGLPQPDVSLPVELPEGHGAIVIRDSFDNTDDRIVMFEPFSSRTYWEGPDYAITVEQPGEYQMIVWQEEGTKGDYIAVIGREEIFGPADIARAAMYTPQIRQGKELHTSCSAVG